MVSINEIETETTTIPFIPVPAHIIKMGASAVLGRAFRITKKGSMTFEKVLFHQRRIAKIIPSDVPIKSPNIVS